MPREDYSDIQQALREGRISEVTAARWVEQRQREIRAHSHQQALQDAHDALDRGHKANYSDDEFAHLFPPHARLGPDDEEDDSTSPTGPGGHWTPPQTRRVIDQQKRHASAYYSDEELDFRLMYGRAPRPGELSDD